MSLKLETSYETLYETSVIRFFSSFHCGLIKSASAFSLTFVCSDDSVPTSQRINFRWLTVVNSTLSAAKMSMTIKETVGRYEGPPRTNNACFLAQQRRIAVRFWF